MTLAEQESGSRGAAGNPGMRLKASWPRASIQSVAVTGPRRTVSDARSMPAYVVDAFRVVTGALLFLHYVDHISLTPALLGDAGVWHPLAPNGPTVFATAATAVARLGVYGVRAPLALGAALSASIALGLAPRACSALLVCVSAVVDAALQPAVVADDAFAQALPFWLLLLPIGKTLSPTGARAWRSWAGSRVNASVVPWSIGFFLIFAMGLSVLDEGAPPMLRTAFFVAAACAIAPLGVWRALAVLPAVVAFWHLPSFRSATLSLYASLAVGALFVGDIVARGADRSRNTRHSSLGVATAIGASAVILLGLHVCAAYLGVPSIVRSTGSVLANVGLPRPSETLINHPLGSPVAVGFAFAGETRVRADDIDFANPRLQVMLRLLQPPTRREEAAARSTLIRNLVTRHCNGPFAADIEQPEQMMLLFNGRARRVATFQCQRQGPATIMDDTPNSDWDRPWQSYR